jgi:putative flippase GtrA
VDIAKILRLFMIYKFIKFIVVGFSGLVIDFSITFVLKEKFKIHRYIANSAGFISAASSNYLFNRWWTFESKNPEVFTEYGTFILISLIGLAINNFFLYVFEKKLKFYFAKFLAIMVTSIWNFTANYYLNFSH